MADLITAQDVEDSLGATYSERADVGRLITAASALVEQHCNRVFAQEDVDEYLDGTGTDCLLVSRPPIASVDSISVDGTDLDNSEETAWNVEADGRAIYRGRGRVDPMFACVWPRGRRNVRVQYTGGFAATPEAVAQATVMLVRQMADGSAYSSILRRETIGDYSYELSSLAVESDELPGVVRALLDPYRLRTIR